MNREIKRAAAQDADGLGSPVPADFRGLSAAFFGETLAAWSRLVAAERLPPVLLLDGRSGLGKRRLAAALAALNVCDAPTAAGPCGRCRGCAWLLAGEHPEVLWLERPGSGSGGKAEPYTVADADALQEHLALMPSEGAKRRIVVMVDADLLTLQAANRLLKTLEEPPPAGLIVLTTSRRRQLPATVLSRCVRWFVAPPPAAATAAWLRQAYEELHGGAPETAFLDELLRRSALAPERALGLLHEAAGGAAGADRDAVLNELLTAPDAAAALHAAEAVSRDKEVSALLLLQSLEIRLNDRYRQSLTAASVPGGDAVDHETLRRRRQLLRRSKQLAGRGRVPLNVQLTAEAVAASRW
jgi:DNA polymerase III delta prime subunit